MTSNKPLPTVWTNDDIGAGQSAQLRTQLKLLDRFEITGTFFMIPDNGRGRLDEDKELLTLVEAARKRGHEFFQHGYKHHGFECGVPSMEMFNIDPRLAELYDRDREAVEALHTLDVLVEMLEKGQKIWRKAFGESSPGFRPGWGAFCTNFYKALTILGYSWVSSRLPSTSCYRARIGEPIYFHPGVKTEPHQLSTGLWEFPIGAEVAWRVPNDPDTIRSMIDLGVEHQRCLTERGHPSLLVSHHHGLSYAGDVNGCAPHSYGTGYAIHEQLLPLIREEGLAEFTSMKWLTAQYLS